jgi:hypothetical protein
MGENLADDLLIDVRGVDIASLMADAAEPVMKTALDRLLISGAGSCNDFNNSID